MTDPLTEPLTPPELAALRARQRSRSLALAWVLVALVVLFFAITLVKMRAERAQVAAMASAPAKDGAQ